MADLGRNINLLSDSVKKNTAAVESMSAESDKGGDKGISDTLNSLDKTLKDIQKVLSSPKPKEAIQPASEKKTPINQTNKPEEKQTTEWKVPSSKGDSFYTVSLKNNKWSCNCVGFSFHHKCRHIDKVKKDYNG